MASRPDTTGSFAKGWYVPEAYTGLNPNRRTWRGRFRDRGFGAPFAAISARTSRHPSRASTKFVVASSTVRPCVMHPGISRQYATYHPSSPASMLAVNTARGDLPAFVRRLRFLIGNTRAAIVWPHVETVEGQAQYMYQSVAD